MGNVPLQDGNEITKKITGCAFEVSNTLGIGFVEKVYENALVHLIRKSGLKVELKAVSTLVNEHTAQALNYLRTSNLEICLLINFGKPKIEITRLLPSSNWKTTKT